MLDQFTQFLNYEWAVRALIASSVVGIMCGVLGVFIVLRNMALIGDALSHAVLPGIVVAFMISGYSLVAFFFGSVVAGLIAAVGITWIQQKIKTKNDAAIGIVFTFMFSLGVIGISQLSKQGGVHLDLKDFLFGNVLGVSDQDLYLTFGTAVVVLTTVVVYYRQLFATTFQPVIAQTMGISVKGIYYLLMLLLSFAVVASLQTVGVILVVAMLITPASTALLLSDRLNKVIVIAAAVGLISAVLGLFVAIVAETTPGPMIAVVSTVIYLAAAILSPSKGLIRRIIHKRKLNRRIIYEDIMKRAVHLQNNNNLSLATLGAELSIPYPRLTKVLGILQRRGYFSITGDKPEMTQAGVNEGQRIIRAHRLWEAYLVQTVGLTDDQIHVDAEDLEHILTEEEIDALDKSLGFPAIDPHGSPIPGKST